jgi:glycosyltransferase involved in cell wall biosynthesis
MKRQNVNISLIVTTYNRPDALNLVLQSLEQQTDKRFEVVIADDGSRQDTRNLIESFQIQSSLNLNHVWHEDLGFRAAAIRNLAVLHSHGEYLIFLDGDCITQPDFIARHRTLMQVGCMVTGSRVLFNPTLTDALIQSNVWDFQGFKNKVLRFWMNRWINKLLVFFLKFPPSRFRQYQGFAWRRIKGCNFACWRQDFDKVQGFDETYVGWGHEDADFAYRLHCQGIKRISGAFATEVMHLHHPENNRTHADKNKSKLLARIASRGLR